MEDIVRQVIERGTRDTIFRPIQGGRHRTDNANITVIGCGGAGNNTVNRLYTIGVEGAETVAINTDKQHLKMIEADTKILIGKSLTNGLNAGGDPMIGERAAEMAIGTIDEVLGDANLLFVTAGMGGGTGTGATPVISKIARERGTIVVAIVSTPFYVERGRMVKAKDGLRKLCKEADSIIVLDNNRLVDYVPNLSIGKTFSVMDQIIAEIVKGISETITQTSLLAMDFTEVASTFYRSGLAVMMVGECRDKNRIHKAVNEAMNHPLLKVDYQDASSGLVYVTGGPDLSLKEVDMIADKVSKRLKPSANVIWGARIQEEYKGEVRIMAIITGLDYNELLGDLASRA